MTINMGLTPLVSLIAGILILVVPRLLNYIVAIYLIVIGLIGLFGAGNYHFWSRSNLSRGRIPRPHADGKPPMLVTFHSKAWSSITMFGDVAVTLLKMAGHSGTLPSALLAGDIPSALARLKQELAADCNAKEASTQSVRSDADDADTPPPVGLRLRAYPLIQMLTAAARQECDVMWEEGAPLV
jgi:Domain of unknown function (DUF1840)/Protein of unknown function (DUF3096)